MQFLILFLNSFYTHTHTALLILLTPFGGSCVFQFHHQWWWAPQSEPWQRPWLISTVVLNIVQCHFTDEMRGCWARTCMCHVIICFKEDFTLLFNRWNNSHIRITMWHQNIYLFLSYTRPVKSMDTYLWFNGIYFIFMTPYIVDCHSRHHNYDWTHKEYELLNKKWEITQTGFIF